MTLAPAVAPEDPATAARAAGDAIAALFDPEFQRVLRRLGDHRRGDAGNPSQDEAAARAAVWSVVAESGALRAGMADSADSAGGGGLRAALPIIELMGESLYQSSYLDTLAAVDAIGCLADPAGWRDLLDGAAAGEVSFALAALEPGGRSPRQPGPMHCDPATGRISGVRTFVRCADSADYLLVAAGGVDDGQPGPLLALVPCDQPGVTLRRQEELGRADLFEVCLDGADVLLAEHRRDPDHAWWAEILDRAQLRHAAYLLGLCRASLSLTLARVKERSVFGRPLGAHQVPAFRLAALAARLEAVRSLVYRSCAQADRAWRGGSAEVATASARSLMLAGELALDVTADSLQLHGAPGLIESSDAQLLYRRALTESALFGRRT
ncbi:MAG TPA: acyl-CoA dehydrogenase family protein [Actinocrinis sp.]